MDKLFVIAIGGTGMRCLESFVNLCAIGMFDEQEIEILTLDTDQSNGNKSRVENLIRLYNQIKSGGNPNSNTFFSAKLNLSVFFTDYGNQNYKQIAGISKGTNEQIKSNKLIADLFLDETTVQEFNLANGYRAQTHLGSMLMYHAIIDAAVILGKGVNVQEHHQALAGYIEKLAQSGSNARVFILGSIFGGTGASSIPVIPKAMQEFIKIRSNDTQSLDFNKTKFGSTLLTEYFTFNKPDEKQKSNAADSVIADSSYFPLNCQAALQFYQNDPTVQSCYKSLYHIGWPIESKKVEDLNSGHKTIIGGASQKNPCHITELLCACAAYDFFNRKSGFDGNKANYYYKAVEYDSNVFNFTFNDLVGNENRAGDLLANRLGAFFALAHIVLKENEAAFGVANGENGIKGILNRFEKQQITSYNSISSQECKDFNEFFQRFAYTVENGQIVPGWLLQLKNSAQGSFLFNNRAFPENEKELNKIDVGKLLPSEKNHWNTTLLKNSYASFVDEILKVSPNEEQKVSTVKEKFMAHIFNAITSLQKLNY